MTQEIVGTNNELLGETTKFTDPKTGQRGRPKANRDLIIRNLKLTDGSGRPMYTYVQIGKIAKCSSKTVRRVRDEALASGELTEDDRSGEVLGIVEGELDAEVMRANGGQSFLTWCMNCYDTPSRGKTIYNFNAKVWDQVWDRPSMVEFMDRQSPVADKCAAKFMEFFGNDKPRIRGRIKQINYIFRFTGRNDVHDRHLVLSTSKHPVQKKRIPEITMLDFPEKLERIIDEMEVLYPGYGRQAMRFKICTLMRTGKKKTQKELLGLRKGSQNAKSYLIMNGPDNYRSRVYCKRGEEWDIIWLPKDVRENLWKRYQATEEGDNLFNEKKSFVADLKKASRRIAGVELDLHAMRKIGLTWFYVFGIPLEVAVNINVGWKDLNTATEHYLDIKKVLRKNYRIEYRNNIPAWFKDGLDDFTGEEATLPGVA